MIGLNEYRALNDANTQEGLDYIVSCFTFEEHKLISARILQTVNIFYFTGLLLMKILFLGQKGGS